MTLNEATPLISSSVDLLLFVIKQVVASTSMSEEEKKAALATVMLRLDSTVERVKNVKLDALP